MDAIFGNVLSIQSVSSRPNSAPKRNSARLANAISVYVCIKLKISLINPLLTELSSLSLILHHTSRVAFLYQNLVRAGRHLVFVRVATSKED